MNETTTTVSPKKFSECLKMAEQEIKLLLAVNDDEHRETARQVAARAVRKLLGFLPNVKPEYQEKAAMAVLSLVSWQCRQTVPEVAETMKTIFGDAMPTPVAYKLKRLEESRGNFLHRTTGVDVFFRHLRQGRRDVQDVFNAFGEADARETAVRVIRELLIQLPEVGEEKEQAAMSLLGLVSWQGREIVLEVAKEMDAVFDGAMPGTVVAKLSGLVAARAEYVRRHPASVKINFSQLTGPAGAGQKGGGRYASHLASTEGKKTNIGNAGNRIAPRASK